MRLLKHYILQQTDQGRLTKDQAFDLLREVTQSELGNGLVAAPVQAAAAQPVAPVIPSREQSRGRGEYAIVGMSCRLPRARSVNQLWKNLSGGVDAVETFPRARIEDVVRIKKSLWDKYHQRMESNEALHGGWLDDVDRFDPGFFGINRADAVSMGPAERLFLMAGWEALESAGLSKKALEGSRTGIYLAHSPEIPFEYARLLPDDEINAVAFNNPGATAYRLAYWLNLRGPTAVVNTTCSSSLVAAHQACLALESGDCDVAIAGGLSLYVFPYFHDTSDPMKLLAPDGRCKAFDAAADGLSMGEGLGLVVLKRLDRALADGDFIHAVIKGSAINSDGRCTGVTAPNPAAQTDVVRRAWERSGVDPKTISYIECHGAGTKLGDPIEIKGLTDAFREEGHASHRVAIGSVKTNLSHLGDAAGIAGLLKVVLSLKHRTIPATLHFKTPSPFIPFDKSPLYVQRDQKAWEPVEGAWRAGVSSFGISGTNCHMIVEAAPAAKLSQTGKQRVLTLSARSLGSLWRTLADFEAFLGEAPPEAFESICYSTLSRDAYEYRAAIVGGSVEELRQKVGRLAQLRHLERLPQSLIAQGVYAARVAAKASELYATLPENAASGSADALVREFCTQPTVEIARYFGPTAKFPLPSYSFDLERFWPAHEVKPQQRFDPFFHSLRWTEKARPEAGALRSGAWLVLRDEHALGFEVEARLREEGAEVITVIAGERFNKVGPRHFVVDPAVPGHFDRMLEELKGVSINGVLHLWTCAPPQGEMQSLEALTRSQDLSCLGLFRLARSLHGKGFAPDAELFVVTAYAHKVDGSEPEIVASRMTAAGFGKVLSQEVPLIHSTAIDFDLNGDLTAQSRTLLQELKVPRTARSEVVAYRGGKRFTQELSTWTEATDGQREIPLRDGGVYVIAGGTGYLGIQLGQHLARRVKNPKVVLLSRTKLPPRQEWSSLMANADAQSMAPYQLGGILEMERLGAEVLHVPMDVTDPVQVKAGFDRVRKQFGAIHGVVVAMKQLAHKPIYTIGEDEFAAGISNRVQGTWLLDKATESDPLDFFILLSSISSIMGTKTASECCAVNQYLDSYPASRAGRPISTMNLTLILDDLRDFRGPTPIPPLNFTEFLGCFDYFLKQGPKLAVVSKWDREEVGYLLPVLKIPFSDELLSSLNLTRQAQTVDSPLAEGLRAAAGGNVSIDEIELELRRLWKEILGEEPEDRDRSFFQVGGTSLTGLKLIKLMKDRWPVKIEPADVYSHSTVKAMAQHLHKLLAGPTVDPLQAMLDQVERGELNVDAAAKSIAGRG